MGSQDPRSLGTVNKKKSISRSGKKKKIFIQAKLGINNPLRKSLRKLSELFCLLEVKAQLYKVFEIGLCIRDATGLHDPGLLGTE